MNTTRPQLAQYPISPPADTDFATFVRASHFLRYLAAGTPNGKNAVCLRDTTLNQLVTLRWDAENECWSCSNCGFNDCYHRVFLRAMVRFGFPPGSEWKSLNGRRLFQVIGVDSAMTAPLTGAARRREELYVQMKIALVDRAGGEILVELLNGDAAVLSATESELVCDYCHGTACPHIELACLTPFYGYDQSQGSMNASVAQILGIVSGTPRAEKTTTSPVVAPTVVKPLVVAHPTFSDRLPNILCLVGCAHDIERSGGHPVEISPQRFLALASPDREALLDRVDGVLLSGGPDIPLHWYGASRSTCPETSRDLAEREACQFALETRRPILGICRGHQLLNVTAGGSLHPDIGTSIRGAQQHRGADHRIFIARKSHLHRIFGSEDRVNSFHHQAVNRVAEGFHPIAWTKDGVIEGIEHAQYPFMGVQFHPEYMRHRSAAARGIFAHFLQSAQTYRAQRLSLVPAVVAERGSAVG